MKIWAFYFVIFLLCLPWATAASAEDGETRPTVDQQRPLITEATTTMESDLARRNWPEQADRIRRSRIGPYIHIPISLGLALLIGLIISQVYKVTHRGMNYELSFMSTLVLLAPIVALVMLFIRGDLVLSLGLIGSLSIIRFRTPIKDTRDMIFLFWTIAVGLGAGTFNWMVVLIATLIMVPMVFLLYFIRYGRSDHADYVLVCGGSGNCPDERIRAAINQEVPDAAVRSHEVNGNQWETVYELRRTVQGAALLSTLIRSLKQIDEVERVSLLAPKLDLPV